MGTRGPLKKARTPMCAFVGVDGDRGVPARREIEKLSIAGALGVVPAAGRTRKGRESRDVADRRGETGREPPRGPVGGTGKRGAARTHWWAGCRSPGLDETRAAIAGG